MRGDVAQLEEHLLCKQGVVGSSPIISTTKLKIIMEYLIALLIGYLVFRFLSNSISSLASTPPEIDPEDVLETLQDFRCNICGTELTIKLLSVVANDPPKHCKEEMQPLD